MKSCIEGETMEATKKTRTDAKRIAMCLGHDRDALKEEDGDTLEQLAKMRGGRREKCDGPGPGTHKWTFPDGSVLMVDEDGWDFGYPGCFCWQGVGHFEACPAKAKGEKP
jgi:hypothetical protein